MSDMMLLGVLRMPADCWLDEELDKSQRHARYIQAADRIEQQAAEIARLSRQLEEMREICERYFVDAMIQPYAGANRECMFCGAAEPRSGKPHHSYADCPVPKYAEIKEQATQQAKEGQ